MGQIWLNITEGQATVVAALLTIIAAIAGVWLGAKLFEGKVKNLQEAIDASETRIRDYVEKVDLTLGSAMEGIAQLRGDVGELRSPGEEKAEKLGDLPAWEKLRDDWNAIRDELEKRAADPEIDGRTRAKYARIDRRKYYDLIDWLEWDENLGADASEFKTAHGIWQQYRSGRKIPDAATLQLMHGLRQRLARSAPTS